MATPITSDELLSFLGNPDLIPIRKFEILKGIAALLNQDNTEELGREMILRALEHREYFGSMVDILDSLTRTVGLFPYVDPETLDLRDRIAYEFHRPSNMSNIVFHREQANIYQRLVAGENIILSAPTSFGKSRIIDAVIATNRYDNIVVIVPTLALIDETRRRLADFSPRYKIITHISQIPDNRNIFILTAERAVAYEKFPRIDFFVIDEFYKIGAIKEDEARTIALNEAFYRLAKEGAQFYLLGPNIQQIPLEFENRYKCKLLFTEFSTVVVETSLVSSRGKIIDRFIKLVKEIKEPTLIFCSSPKRVNEIARAMIDAGVCHEAPLLKDAADWIKKTYHPDWIFGKGLLYGIGIHHGRLPRSLAQYVVRAFNNDKIQFLICTSTLIEGVNTKAKNVIILDHTIAKRQLDFFTFNNIKGRSGRMFQHFVGRVFLFREPPQEELTFVDFPFLTQNTSAPTTLLLQLDSWDLSDYSKKRIKKYTNEKILSLKTLRANRSADPDDQIKLARYIEKNAMLIWQELAWQGFPSNKQLKFVCNLIWKYLVDSDRNQGVFSGSQLNFKTWQLYHTKSIAKRIQLELTSNHRYSAKSPDEAVERILQFERSWAGFELPRKLLTVSRIQQEILSRKNLPSGDYSSFATQLESLFRTPVIAALDEYGIPPEIAEKLRSYLRTKDNLDVALWNLKALDLQQLSLSSFERELVEDAQKALSLPLKIPLF